MLHWPADAEALRRGAQPRSYATVREIVHALDPAMVTLALESPSSYRDQYELALRRRTDRPSSGLTPARYVEVRRRFLREHPGHALASWPLQAD